MLFLLQHFSEGRLSSLHDMYSESGWLVAHRFLGPQAEDPAAATPWGPCVPEANYYMVRMDLTVFLDLEGDILTNILESNIRI